MRITDIRFRKIFSCHNNLLAIVSITLDNELAVHDIKIIRRGEHVFVAMPSREIEPFQFVDVAHPIGVEFRTYLENTILSAYDEYITVQSQGQ